MKRLWLAVVLMLTAMVFYGIKEKQFDLTTTRKPVVRVTYGGDEHGDPCGNNRTVKFLQH